ncbi:ABC transporter permease [Cytophagales bacterium WSM2-2]|nr:ABC transporter permease [Cytophagales bacterium WSM2-2]
MELYKEMIKTSGKRKADFNFVIDVLLLFRPGIIGRGNKEYSINSYAMLKNYFKIGWRSMLRQRMYSFIKIGGFAIGIAACLLITLFIREELSYDTRYQNGDRIFRVVVAYNFNGESGKDVWFQAPFAKALKDDYPEIEKVGRYNSSELFGAGSAQIRRDDQPDNTYEEGFVYADQALLEILQVPMVYGSLAHCLDNPKTIVITKRKADKFFPNENPVGKLMIVNNNEKEPYRIGGVIENLPPASHLQYDFFLTMTGVEFWKGEQSDWGATNYPTYIQLREGSDKSQLEKKMIGVINKYLLPRWIKDGVPNADVLAKSAWFILQPVKDIYLKSEGISDPVSHGDIRFVWLFGAIAAFILLIACINFINLSTAKSANRAKEVGLRKTVGSNRSSIINQFLTESLLFSFISFGLGLMLAELLMPFFNSLAAKSLFIPWKEWWFIPIVVASSVIIGILAGIYPSFYLSSFKPIQVLKGNLSKGSKNSFTRSTLVVFQFTTSIVLIIATAVIYRQVNFILNTKVGFDKDQVLVLRGTSTLGNQVKTFKDELQQLASVKGVTVSDYLPIKGTKRNGNGFWIEGKQNEDHSLGVQFWRVDPDYIKTMGMKIVDGRNFSPDAVSDSASIIINQTMARKLGLKDPVGKRVQNWRAWNVVGVVEDFNFESLRNEVGPLCMVLGESPGIVSVKLNAQSLTAALPAIESLWKKIAPHQPIRYSFLDESFARMYDDVKRMGRIFTSFAVLAIIVACLGLFALSSFMVEQRGKEISIRLVLGASLQNIFSILTVNFLKLIVVSIFIAGPIAWYMMNQWLLDFNYRTKITWDVFAITGGMAILIALFTISYQAIRAALAKPVNNLRSE